MTIIEAMKQKKALLIKAQDLRTKVGKNSAHYEQDTSEYDDPKKQVSDWVQAHTDVVKEIERLSVAIQRTNIATDVSIDLGGKTVTKTIAAWIHRRRTLSVLDFQMQQQLTDRGLETGHRRSSIGDDKLVEVKLVRNYSAEERDERMAVYQTEPIMIDSRLEVVNATTELVA